MANGIIKRYTSKTCRCKIAKIIVTKKQISFHFLVFYNVPTRNKRNKDGLLPNGNATKTYFAF